jgi:flagellar M-ring protein FliF
MMLANVLGPGRASVVVRAQLDFDERATEAETYSPESATPVRQQTVEETFTGEGAAPAGSVGTDGAPAPSGDGTYDYTRNEDTTEFGIDRLVTRTTETPGSIERLSVAVVVDDGSLTGQGAPDVAALDALVGAAVGLQAERGDTVEVSAVPFPAAPEPEAVEEPSGVMTMLPTIIGAVVVLVVSVALFLMTRSGKKRGKAKKGEVVDGLEALPAGQVYDAEALAKVNAMNGMTDDVIGLVERQPEEIAILLRSWLADRRDPVA